MSSLQLSAEPVNGRRRFYVFLAVALAQFVLAMALIGMLCEGFAIPDPEIQQNATKKQTQAHAAILAAEQAEAAMTDAVEEYADSRRASHEAMQKYDVARKNLLDYLERHFADLQTGSNSASKPAIAATPALADADSTSVNKEDLPAPASTLANPQWKKLRDTLADLLRQRDDLLVKLTPSHPTVKALDLTIAEVETQIADTPEEVRQPESRSEPIAHGAAASDSLDVGANLIDSEPFRKLSSAEEAARKEYQDKLSSEELAWQRQSQEIEEGFQVLVDSAAEPVEPVVIASVTGANVAHSLALSAIWALAMAWIVARKACVNEKAFESPAEVRQTLDLPILGLLPTNPHAAKELPRREPRWVRRTVMSSEAWLVGVAVLLAVVSLLDASFFHDLLADPLAACSKRFW